MTKEINIFQNICNFAEMEICVLWCHFIQWIPTSVFESMVTKIDCSF